MKKTFIIILLLAVITALLIYFFRDNLQARFFAPRPSTVPEGISLNKENEIEIGEDISQIAENLSIPWEMAWLPDGSYLVTERPGSLVRINPSDEQRIQIEDVIHTGEGGLMGMALHPDFNDNNYIYIYFTSGSRGVFLNRVDRYVFSLLENNLSNRTEIIGDIPGAAYHDGGRIAFGPDGYLYIATGDAGEPDLAQNLNSLAGKILRLADDGSIPPENPFDSPVYSYGHRNVQGLAWDSQGRLWASEHGPVGFDEINLITSGGNYGWPLIRGDERGENLLQPILHSGASDTWAPTGVLIVNDRLMFTGLRGQAIYSADISNGELSNFKRNFFEDFGRLRFIKHREGGFYIGTNNTDGRGSPADNDDRIIRLKDDLLLNP